MHSVRFFPLVLIFAYQLNHFGRSDLVVMEQRSEVRKSKTNTALDSLSGIAREEEALLRQLAYLLCVTPKKVMLKQTAT